MWDQIRYFVLVHLQRVDEIHRHSYLNFNFGSGVILLFLILHQNFAYLQIFNFGPSALRL